MRDKINKSNRFENKQHINNIPNNDAKSSGLKLKAVFKISK